MAVLWPGREESALISVLLWLRAWIQSPRRDGEVPDNHAPTAPTRVQSQNRVQGRFQRPERIWGTTTRRKCVTFAVKQECEHLGIFFFFFFFFLPGLYYQLGISLFTNTRSSCIRCNEGTGWTICIIWCHWRVSCSRWVPSRAIYWSLPYKIPKTAVCKVSDRAVSASCCLYLLHLLYLQLVKILESWSKILGFANTI